MTTNWPSSCIRAVSQYRPPTYRYNANPLFRSIVVSHLYQSRSYATQNFEIDLERHEKAALFEIQRLRKPDPLNPPRSTIPPPLKLPEQGDANIALYYIRLGRAYGSFYWMGVKAVWFNRQAAELLKTRIKRHRAYNENVDVTRQTEVGMTRSEFQLLVRNNHDIGKLPFFGLLVALFGEWLPLIVPFIPAAAPGTCRIPKQIEGMRRKSEERRAASFRAGIEEPTVEETVVSKAQTSAWPTTQTQYATKLLAKLRDDQLLHLSSTLNLHNRMWDRLRIAPPSSMLRKRIVKHVSYLALDDSLLLQQETASKALEYAEVQMACEERGLDVLGKREEVLRFTLHEWLERQKREGGNGKSMLKMLFRRPNAWNTGSRTHERKKTVQYQ